MAKKPVPGPKPGDPMFSGRPALGNKPKPVKPVKPGPTPRKVGGMVNPGKKQPAPGKLTPMRPGKPKPVAPRKGGK